MPGNAAPDIIAKIRFYTTAEGGRSGPIYGKTFDRKIFQCIFVLPWGNFDCALWVEDFDSIELGQTLSIPVSFLVPELLRERLHPGDLFHLQDYRTIAEGRIEAVLAEEMSRENNPHEKS